MDIALSKTRSTARHVDCPGTALVHHAGLFKSFVSTPDRLLPTKEQGREDENPHHYDEHDGKISGHVGSTFKLDDDFYAM